MGYDDADAGGNADSTLRVGQLDFDGIVEVAKRVHGEGFVKLWAILDQLDRSEHGRARRIACERILRAYDRHGQAALKLFTDIWTRAQRTTRPTRFFLAAAAAEIDARRWG